MITMHVPLISIPAPFDAPLLWVGYRLAYYTGLMMTPEAMVTVFSAALLCCVALAPASLLPVPSAAHRSSGGDGSDRGG